MFERLTTVIYVAAWVSIFSAAACESGKNNGLIRTASRPGETPSAASKLSNDNHAPPKKEMQMFTDSKRRGSKRKGTGAPDAGQGTSATKRDVAATGKLLSASDERTAPCGTFSAGVAVGTLFQGIVEVSGLVHSSIQPDVLWIHEDSGTAPLLYGIRTNGELLGKWQLGDASTLLDWEDIAMQPRKNKPGFIWVADIGDNIARESAGQQGRHHIEVIRVEEPVVGVTAKSSSEGLEGVTVFEFTYPERPWDAEAMTVDPVTGDVYIFTKVSQGKAPVFVAKAPIQSGLLQQIGAIDFPWMTAADMAANGRELIVRNYLVALHWERKAAQPWAEVIASKPTIVSLKLERQGESVGYRHDGAGFYTISEGESVPVYYYEKRCPGKGMSPGTMGHN